MRWRANDGAEPQGAASSSASSGISAFSPISNMRISSSRASMRPRASNWPLLHIVLPLGISFFTFQKIAYLADIHAGLAKPGPLIDFALFVFFFPQLIAGPIVHHSEVMPQFRAMAGEGAGCGLLARHRDRPHASSSSASSRRSASPTSSLLMRRRSSTMRARLLLHIGLLAALARRARLHGPALRGFLRL